MRLFFAVEAPKSSLYGDVTREILERHPGARPVPTSSWHLTLRFLGEAPDPEPIAAAAREALRGFDAMPVVVRGLGAFPSPRKARVAWAGVEAPGLDRAAAAVAQATPLARDPDSGRPFHPHVTLARLDPPVDLRDIVQRHAGTRFASGLVREIVLLRSDLGSMGPAYSRVAAFPLQVR